MPDLVGIGSVNVDVIVEAGRAEPIDLAHPDLGLTAADLGSERAVDADRVRRAVEHLAPLGPVLSPGGSSLNVVSSVAAARTRFTVGHIGVLGRAGPPGLDLTARLDELGVDTTLVEVVDGPPGMCLSLNRDGERTLLTTGGVNDRLGRWLVERRAAIDAYLATALAVHVTALAGLDDLGPLVDVVERYRRTRPDGLLCCDPGAIWTSPSRPPEADEILSRSHVLLVNRREATELGGPPAMLDRWPLVATVVVKGADRVDIHHRGRAVTLHHNPRVLEADEIVDDTGSGDAFAAGYLIGRLAPELTEADGVALGMDLARAKLTFPGTTGIGHYPPLWRRFGPRI